MIKRLITFWVAAFVLGISGAFAQIVTTSPALLQEASKDVVLTYHADSPLGNGGLKGLSATTPVYAHIGVITNKSADTSDWKYAPSKWGDNAAKYKLKYVSPNTYTLSIGDIRTYFGITDASETVQKIAVVFRTGDCNKEGKTSSGGDILVDVLEPGFQMSLTVSTPKVITAEAKATLTVNTTEPCTIELYNGTFRFGRKSNATTYSSEYNMAVPGTYDFKAVATTTDGSKTMTKTYTVSYITDSPAGTYPGGVPKMGAVKNADGTVTFCIAAPGKKNVMLVGAWSNYSTIANQCEMKYQDYNGQRYFFRTVSDLKDYVWYPYYYIVDGTTKVGDPYAHMVLDPYSDKWIDSSIWPDMPKYPYERFDDTMLAVYRGDLDGNYKFSDFTIPDHRNLVIYEMLVRDFTGTDRQAKGEGTLRKAIEKIPYLRSLGINAVELMPVMEFNGNNSWGYNTNFYMAPDKAYGSPKDLKDFVELCHQNGIAVVLDIVFNQSDGLHPWYQMYPIASNPFYNQTAPHDYSVLNDWKQENPLVRQQWKDAIKYWMTAYNVDGFRFDLVKGLGTSYPSGTEAYNSSRVAVMKDLHAAIKAVKPNGIHINENLAGDKEENEMAADGQLNWANINYNSCQFGMGYASGSNLERFLSTSDSRTAFSTVAYAESHDEERVGYKQKAYGYGSVKEDQNKRSYRLAQLAVQMLLTPGPKMIWQFGEFGADQTTKNSDNSNNTDPKTVVWYYKDATDHVGIFEAYQAMCNLRRNNPDLFINGTFTQVGMNTQSFSTNRIIRINNGDREIIALINPNVDGAAKNVGYSVQKISASNYQILSSSRNLTATPTFSGTTVKCTIPANGYIVLGTKSVLGVDDVTVDADPTTAVKVYVDGREIVIAGEYTTATVYNVAGTLQPSLSVSAPGLYIVTVDGTAHKVLVR